MVDNELETVSVYYTVYTFKNLILKSNFSSTAHIEAELTVIREIFFSWY